MTQVIATGMPRGRDQVGGAAIPCSGRLPRDHDFHPLRPVITTSADIRKSLSNQIYTQKYAFKSKNKQVFKEVVITPTIMAAEKKPV
jgi:hypothetical protein